MMNITNNDAECALPPNPQSAIWVVYGGEIILLYIVVMSLFALANVCEEYFVPALEIFCRLHYVPDSVAGSLVMAAGNDAPELFVSIIGIFVQHSAIGLGTIIGSDIFNNMCISAGSVWYSSDGYLKLDSRQFTRDCIAYAASLFVFLGVIGVDYYSFADKYVWTQCLQVNITGSVALVCGQLLYCIFVTTLDPICDYIDDLEIYETVMRKIYPEEEELPVHNAVPYSRARGRNTGSVQPFNPLETQTTVGVTATTTAVIGTATGTATGGVACTTNTGASNSFCTTATGVSASGTDGAVVFVQRVKRKQSVASHSIALFAELRLAQANNKKNQREKTYWEQQLFHVWGYCCWPIEQLHHHTIMDCKPFEKEIWFPATIGMCFFWLAAWAYILCEVLALLGILFGISPLVMGLTFSAVGTSFPNFYSSIVVAKLGKGDFAISNALGSNIYNVFVALGLPWLIYTIAFGPYRKLQNDGIVYLTIALIGALFLFYIAVVISDWKMHQW